MVHRYRDRILGFTKAFRLFQPCIPLRLTRYLESTLGQDLQPFRCGKSGPPDLRYSVDIHEGLVDALYLRRNFGLPESMIEVGRTTSDYPQLWHIYLMV